MLEYVFYCVAGSDDKLKENGFSFGIKKGSSLEHEHYFYSFLETDIDVFNDIDIPSYWHDAMGTLAEKGHMMIVNSAIEIKDLDKRMYLIYLPSNPSNYQISMLYGILKELDGIPIEFRVYGEDKQIFDFYSKVPNIDKNKLMNIYLTYEKSRVKAKRNAMIT